MRNPSPENLPREQPPRSSARRVAALMIGTALLLAGLNEAARRLLQVVTPNIGYALVAQKWKLLLERERPVDWLIVGDSSCNQGIDPALLAEHLGGDALNLCTVASSLVLGSAWMLDRHVQRLGPPGAVLAIHAHHVWSRELEPFALAHVPLPWGFWRELDPPLAPDPRWIGRAFVARYLPLYAEHRSLAQVLMRPWLARPHYRVDARGFMPVASGSSRGVEKDAHRRLAELTRPGAAALSEPNRAALAHLGRLADRHGFDVYLAEAPVYRGIAEAPAFQRQQRELAARIAEVAARHPHLHVLTGLYSYPIDAMQNGDHLLAPAAARYTLSVAAEIAALRETRLAGRAARP